MEPQTAEMTAPAPPRRRWFRYSLRTLFVVVTLFCVWLGVQAKWIRDRNNARQWIAQHGGYDTLDDHDALRRDAPWQIALFDMPTHVIYLTDESAEDEQRVRDLERLFPEAFGIYELRPMVSLPLGGWHIGHYSNWGRDDPLKSRAKRP